MRCLAAAARARLRVLLIGMNIRISVPRRLRQYIDDMHMMTTTQTDNQQLVCVRAAPTVDAVAHFSC